MKVHYLSRNNQRTLTARPLSKILSTAILAAGLLLPNNARPEEAARAVPVSAGSGIQASLHFPIEADLIQIERVDKKGVTIKIDFPEGPQTVFVNYGSKIEVGPFQLALAEMSGPTRLLKLKTLYLCVDIKLDVGKFDRKLFKQGRALVTWRTNVYTTINREEVKPGQPTVGLCGGVWEF